VVGISVTGLLLIGATLTLVLLILVIMQKEPPETTDMVDRVLLIGAFSALGVAMLWGGLSLLGGVLADALPETLVWSVWFSNSLYIIFITLGWVKIIRNYLHNRRS
jgi:hypothetical protein